ncbi:EcsC family protein [Methylococcus capsulatus]|uniref:EcsC family protein n=1 Tax=Methylococcus capsulatus TaxID=414 RepID=UPI001C52C680|nr:EcsC family protein [Methylococcus capsulatus]QXP88179.1 EcsC family protein [Methylococcus capsulatus]QXP94812.1 EcsC family protein [Methylococcus capsulatus]UQN13216.1 EcsC family protein [Methylococcus capsulatus]
MRISHQFAFSFSQTFDMRSAKSKRVLPFSLTPDDRRALQRAFDHLEYPSFAARLSGVVGTPIEMAVKLLPRSWYMAWHRGVDAAVAKALSMAIGSLSASAAPLADRRYWMMGAVSGAVGGFFGGPALLLEIPLTTVLMLRAIADIARQEGEDVESPEGQLACLEVFALGGRSSEDDAADTGYYGLRLALELPLSSAARHIARRGLDGRSAPALVNLVGHVSERFGVALSERAAAKLIPVVGALGGALINNAFIQHFQDTARSHFTIRRLERKYSRSLIEAEYKKLKRRPGKASVRYTALAA